MQLYSYYMIYLLTCIAISERVNLKGSLGDTVWMLYR
jgi:hypothetical protein